MRELHSKVNASYLHVKIYVTQAHDQLLTSYNGSQNITTRDLPNRVIPAIWIVVATFLGLALLLTLGICGGIRIFLRRQLIKKHKTGNYDDILFVTSTAHNIPRNYVPTRNEVKSSPVFWKIMYPNVTQKEH